SPAVPSWTASAPLFPFSVTYSSPISFSGTGGFYYSSSYGLQLASRVSAPEGSVMIWDAIITYAGDLAGLGLTMGDSGTLAFTDGLTVSTIDWTTAAAIPEPATSAQLVGLGLVGFALMRRRVRRG